MADVQASRAVQLNPKSGLALLTLASLQAAGGRKEEAAQSYQRLSALPDPRYKSVYGLYLFQIGRRQEAIAELSRLYLADPHDRTLRTQLVHAYRANGQDGEAERVINGALKRNPKDVDALIERSDFRLLRGKTAEAEQDLSEALQYQHNSVPAQFELARLYHQTGRILLERQELQQILQLRPDFLAARLQLAHDLTAANEAATALHLLENAPARQKRTPPLIVERNAASQATGDWAAFRTGIEEGLAIERSADLLVQDGIFRLHQNDGAAARTDAREMLQRYPDDIRGAMLLASSYASEKQPSKAVDALRELAAAHPGSAPLQELYGDWSRAAGNHEAAREAYRAAKAADPNLVDADLALALLDAQDQRVDAARQTLTAVLQSHPADIKALLMLATIQPPPDAIPLYRQVLQVDSKNAFALNNLAYLLAGSDPDDALKYAEQAVEITPDSASAQDTIGWIFYRKGIYDRAAAYLRTAVDRAPTPRHQFHLALCYLKTGELVQGRQLMAAALAKDPKLSTTEQGW